MRQCSHRHAMWMSGIPDGDWWGRDVLLTVTMGGESTTPTRKARIGETLPRCVAIWYNLPVAEMNESFTLLQSGDKQNAGIWFNMRRCLTTGAVTKKGTNK